MRRRNWYERGERRFRLILLGILILMLAAIHFIDPSFYPTIYHLSKDGDLHGTIHYLKGFALYQKGQTEEGRQQMQEAMHIFDVLGLPEQVAYYQEHFDKFVKNECSK